MKKTKKNTCGYRGRLHIEGRISKPTPILIFLFIGVIYSHVIRFSLSIEMSRLMRDGTAEPVSRDQILRRERGQGNIHFLCSADHEQDWQPYPVDRYSCYM